MYMVYVSYLVPGLTLDGGASMHNLRRLGIPFDEFVQRKLLNETRMCHYAHTSLCCVGFLMQKDEEVERDIWHC
jgi:hypothetical protein